MLKDIVKKVITDYNKVIQLVNNFSISESSNIYGHTKEFMKLKKVTRYEAHRVISPIALRLAGIEDAYSVTDINGNTYKFDIFEDGNYRVFELEIFSNIIEEVADEKYFKKNS